MCVFVCLCVCVMYLTALSVQCYVLHCVHSALVGIGRQSTNLTLLLLFRQIVARGLLDVLREFSDNENDFISVMETVARMSEDGGRCILLLIYLVVLS